MEIVNYNNVVLKINELQEKGDVLTPAGLYQLCKVYGGVDALEIYNELFNEIYGSRTLEAEIDYLRELLEVEENEDAIVILNDIASKIKEERK